MKQRKLLIAASAVLLLVFLVGGWIHFSTFEEKERFVGVTGQIINPVTQESVSDVDLTVGDTSIRTTSSGQFTFTEVSTKAGIRLTHPELLRAFAVLPVAAENLLFDIDLYNTLVFVVESEARGTVDATYERLSSRIQESISKEEYRELFDQLFTEENITDQEIIIKNIILNPDYFERLSDRRFSNVLELEIVRGKDTKWYRFVEQEGSWKYIL